MTESATELDKAWDEAFSEGYAEGFADGQAVKNPAVMQKPTTEEMRRYREMSGKGARP